MITEYEAIFLNIDEQVLREKLAALGARCVKPRTLMRRLIFENGALPPGAWVRLRDEGDAITLTLKQVADEDAIGGKREVSLTVSDFDVAAAFLELSGFTRRNYQENYREEWIRRSVDGEVIFDFDTWPDLPTFLEIEGPDEESVRQAAAEFGLDFAAAEFGSSDAIYRKVLGRDILKEPELRFRL